MSNGRSERRIPKTVSVEVCLADDVTFKERTLTENVSAHGVRVLTQQSMRPKQQAMVISPSEGVWSRAKVVYCQRAAENRFAVGLELFAIVDSWASPY
ncbi:MAG TPA: PilZ domain-containing protein [Candidatus Acidoferrum sp.]|nr:PilZ domain-containing protein [Candidatus Acidoferrum sp.]